MRGLVVEHPDRARYRCAQGVATAIMHGQFVHAAAQPGDAHRHDSVMLRCEQPGLDELTPDVHLDGSGRHGAVVVVPRMTGPPLIRIGIKNYVPKPLTSNMISFSGGFDLSCGGALVQEQDDGIRFTVGGNAVVKISKNPKNSRVKLATAR